MEGLIMQTLFPKCSLLSTSAIVLSDFITIKVTAVTGVTLSARGRSLCVRICRLQPSVPTYKDGSRTERIKIFIMAVDP